MHWVDGLVQGILLGGLYAQYALGMALMFGVMRIVNITHGDLMILLALIGISLASTFALGPWSVLVILVALGAMFGVLLQRLILNRVVGDDPLPSLIATFGLSVALQNAMQQIWSADTRSLPSDGLAQASVQIGPLFVGVLPVIVLCTATVLTAGLDAALRYTKFGRALRAASADVEAAAMAGVNPKRIYAGATALAVAILGFAAVFQSLRATVAPADGAYQLIYAFEAVIIGGMGSIWGAFIGAMVLGISQSIGFRIDPGFGILAGHLVFLVILALRPQGILGKG
ncbi:MAG: branched-chain amino acid ABC transporter permease [Rhizobium sp.]|nr:branched-chain amino acid ABC transporter permease [Rhizobium sp.]